MAVALETAAAQAEAAAGRPGEEVPEQLRPFVASPAGERILGATEAAARLGVSRTTVYDWADRNGNGTGTSPSPVRVGIEIPDLVSDSAGCDTSILAAEGRVACRASATRGMCLALLSRVVAARAWPFLA